MTKVKVSKENSDITYITISWNRGKIHKTVKVSPHCNVDLDKDGYPIGVETL